MSEDRYTCTYRQLYNAFGAPGIPNTYGGGISSMWGAGAIPVGVTIHWDEDYRPDWFSDRSGK